MKLIVKSKAVAFRRKEYAPGDPIDVPDNIGKNLIKSGACEKAGEPESRKQKKEAEPVIPAKAGIQSPVIPAKAGIQKGDEKC